MHGALALRPGGPPSFRLTGIGPRSRTTPMLQRVGWKLASSGTITSTSLPRREMPPPRTSNLSCSRSRVARPPRSDEREVLATVNAVKPRILFVVGTKQTTTRLCSMSGSRRHFTTDSTMFDSLEEAAVPARAAGSGDVGDVWDGRSVMWWPHGAERAERHGRFTNGVDGWERAGFVAPSRSSAFKRTPPPLCQWRWLRVEEKEGCLTLGWHTALS
ncbi:hypothetical protein HPP92_015895 [Vanilla planifolia]|uniref:Uncharacterized protein n=1 Tax=Vanilla planifolia TaxID=51239 RepID=A0A835QF50_VANPL|nr:hypothetical protein HPP92_016526 [Vanilla planifolia]KAG0471349.1 hypothetical protein HPP92_015895 [Vanilla planifolia]